MQPWNLETGHMEAGSVMETGSIMGKNPMPVSNTNARCANPLVSCGDWRTNLALTQRAVVHSCNVHSCSQGIAPAHYSPLLTTTHHYSPPTTHRHSPGKLQRLVNSRLP